MKHWKIFLMAALAIGAFAQSEVKPKIGGSGDSRSRQEKREDAATRSALGVVTGADDQPVTGAIVQVKDLRTLQVRSFITQADGAYHFSGLKNDNDYELLAKSGELTAGPRKLSIFDNRKEAVINFKFEKK